MSLIESAVVKPLPGRPAAEGGKAATPVKLLHWRMKMTIMHNFKIGFN